ncbi:MAG TPA: hypothetical protein VGH73_14845 [Thermoanaerobaculia bacterium]|jgi:hypothetical protein
MAGSGKTKSTQAAAREANALPAPVKALFWDVSSRSLRWDRDRELITGRVLASGPWNTVQWLRARAGDEAIRAWIEAHEGRGLSPRQLRFWQLILNIPARQVDRWLQSDGRKVWDRRTQP